jgi:hypothetical protein
MGKKEAEPLAGKSSRCPLHPTGRRKVPANLILPFRLAHSKRPARTSLLHLVFCSPKKAENRGHGQALTVNQGNLPKIIQEYS